MQKLFVTIIAAAVLSSCGSSSPSGSSSIDGTACANPGATTCQGEQVFICNMDTGWTLSRDCSKVAVSGCKCAEVSSGYSDCVVDTGSGQGSCNG